MKDPIEKMLAVSLVVYVASTVFLVISIAKAEEEQYGKAP